MVDEPKPEVDLSSPETKETSQPEVYSRKQVDSLMEKVRSDSLAELGRVRKAAEEAIKKSTEAANKNFQAILKQREDEELAAAKDEPDKQVAIRERQQRRQKEAELAQAQEELNESKARLQELSQKTTEFTRDQISNDIAKRLKVDPVKLAKLVKFTDGSAQAIEEIASEMPKLTPPPQNNFRPDSNETTGGSQKSVTQVQQDFIAGKISNAQYSEKMKALGKSP